MKRKWGVLAAAAAVLLTVTCKAPDLFSEYDGQSFLSTTSLQSDSWQLMPDYSFETGTTADDYMDYTLQSSTGGPSGGPVYRLEIKNLLQNGDFETGATTAPWFLYNSTTKVGAPGNNDIPGTLEIINSGVYEIDNNTTRMTLLSDERAKIVLKSAFTKQETYVPSKSYFFSYDYRTNAPISIFFFPDWNPAATEPDELEAYQAFGGPGGTSDNQSESIRNEYPPLNPVLTNPKVLNKFNASDTVLALNNDTLGFSGNAQGGSYDNFRIVRSPEGEFDLRLRLKMNLDHRNDLTLIPGYYRFSVYVKQESIGANNIFHADRVELSIQGYDVDNQLNVEDAQVFYKTQLLSDTYSELDGGSFPGDWSSNWVQLVLASDKTFQVPDISADTVMELTIAPSNPGSRDNSWNRLTAGSLLISEPILEYSSVPW